MSSESANATLGLEHPELGQMAPGLGLLGAEGGTEAVHLAECGTRRLHVQLPGLRQEGALAEVFGLEQGARGFADGAGEDGGVDADEIALVQEVVDALLHLGADAQAGALGRGAQPEMPVIEQELDAVLLGLDGEVPGRAQQPHVLHKKLVAARRACVLLHRAGDRHAGFLRECAAELPGFGGELLAQHDALCHAGAVAHHQEGNPAVDAHVLHPAAYRDAPAGAGAEFAYDGFGGSHGGLLRWNRRDRRSPGAGRRRLAACGLLVCHGPGVKSNPPGPVDRG